MEEHCYIVCYDLCAPGRNYDSLYSALKQYAHWGKLTESAWAIVTSETYVQVRDNLKQYIDDNDRLIVIRAGKEAAWTKVRASEEWVKKNIIK